MNLGVLGTSVQQFVRRAIGGLMIAAVAACGGGGGSPGIVAGEGGSSATTPASISLLFSSTELPSSGVAGTEVTVTALVKNSSNNSIAAVPVTFTADSGALTNVSSATDTSGKATALLGTSGDRTNRTITITAKAGSIAATGTVKVVGTAVSVTGPATVTSGSTGDFAITVRDQAGAAIAGIPVTVASAKGNAIAVKTSGGGTSSIPLTNSQGQVVVTVTGSQTGSDTLSASAQGSNTAYAYSVNSQSLTVSTTASQANISACTKISARYENAGVGQNGTINISTSRGRIFSDSACATELGSSSVPVTGGNAQETYIKSDTIGVATITATVVNGPTAQANLEFVAPLGHNPSINVQPEPAIISPSGTGQGSTSVLTVVVRDSANNLVKGAVVEFSIISDQSGGTLSNPSVVTTGSDGSARVTFTAGASTTAFGGVQIDARLQGTEKKDTATLTVSRKSLFITAGVGNTLVEPTPATYRQDYVVIVSDASGNPVPEVTVTAAADVVSYYKGRLVYDSDLATPKSGWIYSVDTPTACPNEDRNPRDGILGAGEDDNLNGKLEPRIPLTVTSSGKTDANGTATISILYPQDRALWTRIKLIVTGSVAGTEWQYTTSEYTLPALAADLSDASTQPPGYISPYGENPCHIAD